MLPFPTEYPLIPIQLCSLETAPVLPSVRTGPNTSSFIAGIFVELINDISQKAQVPNNPLRMFVYNMLSANHWQNDAIRELLQFTVDLIELHCLSGEIKSVPAAISDYVRLANTLYTSSILFNYPELKAITNPRQVEAAYQNAGHYSKVKAEIFQMYNHGQYPQGHGMGHMPQQHQQPHPYGQPAMQPGHYPHGYPQQPHHGHMNPGAVHQGHPNMMPHHGHMQPMMHHPHHAMQYYAPQPTHNTNMGGWGTTPVSHNQTLNQGTDATFDRWGSTPSSNQQTQPQQEPSFDRYSQSSNSNQNVSVSQRSFYIPDDNDVFDSELVESSSVEVLDSSETVGVKGDSIPTLTIKGTDSMDRSKHEVLYFGDSYSGDSITKTRKFEEFTEQIANPDSEEIKNKGSELVLDKDIVSIQTDLDSIITNGKVKQLSREVESPMYRIFGYLFEPVVSKDDVGDFFKEIKNATSYTGIAAKIKSIAMSLQELKQKDPAYAERVVSALSHIDVRLTEITNDFLNNNLGLDVHIESYSEDIGALEGFIRNKHGDNKASSFLQYMKGVTQSFTKDYGEEIEQAMRDQHSDETDGVYINFITSTVSVTYIDLNDRELSYDINRKEIRKIEKNKTLSLFNVAKSLHQHKLELNMPTVKDILVTADGSRYQLVPMYDDQDTFLLRKM